MANVKISELTELTVPADDDEIAIVDKDVVTTKKITRANLYSDATSSAKGLATATQITKLDGIEAGSTDDQTGAEIKTAYEAEANAYTDTKDTKLAGIEAVADVTDEANVTAALPVVDGTSLIKGSVDSTKQARFEVDGLTTSTTRALTIQDKNITIADNADVVLRVEKATFNANTILKADSDNTPAALTVGEQTLLGRITAGVITALTPTQIRTLVNVADGADVTGDNAPQAHEHVSTEITVSTINTPTYNDIQDWINNTQSAGRMSGGATTAHTDSITGVTVGGIGSGEFKVAGDQTACYIVAEPLLVEESTNNDGYYTIASGVAYSGGTTTIPVEEAVGAVADGIIYNGTVDVSDGTGFIKQTDSDIAETVSFDIHADTNIILTDVTTNYLYVDYNSGAPDIKVTTDRDSIENNRQFTLSMVYRNGARVWACSCGVYLPNFLIGNHERLLIARGYERGSGGEISEYGTRNIQSTSGVFFRGATRVDTTAKASVTDKITTVYYDGSDWVWTENETQVDNTYYNNIATGLVELGTSKYAVHWACIDYLSNLYIVYGRGSYSLAEAQLAGVPSLMPVVASGFGIVAAKIIIQKGASSFAELISAYTQVIPSATPTTHNDLSGLNVGDYKHFTATEKTKFDGIDAGADVTADNPPQAHNQAASTISDFDTEVANNSAVSANTSKVTNATHTGDVAGATELTIETDAVDIPMLSASGTADSSTYLRGDNTWSTPSGSGDVSKVGTPVDNQVGVWTGDGTIEGTSGLTYSGTALDLTGNLTLSGTVDGINIATDVAANTAKVTNATHTGEVTGSGELTIENDAVTYAKMQNVSATDKVLGRATAGSGDVEEITVTVAGRAILDDADAAAQRTTLGITDKRYIQIRLLGKNTSHTVSSEIEGDFRFTKAMTITGVSCYFDTAGTTSVTTIDINEAGTTILSTKLTVDATEKTSETAAIPAVISDSAIAANAVITFDIDGIASGTAGKGLVIELEVTTP